MDTPVSPFHAFPGPVAGKGAPVAKPAAPSPDERRQAAREALVSALKEGMGLQTTEHSFEADMRADEILGCLRGKTLDLTPIQRGAQPGARFSAEPFRMPRDAWTAVADYSAADGTSGFTTVCIADSIDPALDHLVDLDTIELHLAGNRGDTIRRHDLTHLQPAAGQRLTVRVFGEHAHTVRSGEHLSVEPGGSLVALRPLGIAEEPAGVREVQLVPAAPAKVQAQAEVQAQAPSSAQLRDTLMAGPSGMPLLHLMAMRTTWEGRSPDSHLFQLIVISQYVLGALKLPMDLDDKKSVLASSGASSGKACTAAQRALSEGEPAAAAMMLQAVLATSASPNPSKEVLAKALGVRPVEVMKALRKSGWTQYREWSAKMLMAQLEALTTYDGSGQDGAQLEKMKAGCRNVLADMLDRRRGEPG